MIFNPINPDLNLDIYYLNHDEEPKARAAWEAMRQLIIKRYADKGDKILVPLGAPDVEYIRSLRKQGEYKLVEQLADNYQETVLDPYSGNLAERILDYLYKEQPVLYVAGALSRTSSDIAEMVREQMEDTNFEIAIKREAEENLSALTVDELRSRGFKVRLVSPAEIDKSIDEVCKANDISLAPQERWEAFDKIRGSRAWESLEDMTWVEEVDLDEDTEDILREMGVFDD